jgi:molecular chaperone GrpE (heat shock protein)
LTLGISSVVLGFVAIGAVVYAIDKKRFASRRQDDVVRMKMERDRLQQENYDLKAKVSLQPVNTVAGRLAAVQDGYSSDRNFQALNARLEQLATSINELHQQLEAVRERLTPQRDTTVDQFLDGIRQGLVNSEPQHSAHGFLNQVERLCDRWLSDPAIAEKLSTLLRAYRDRAAAARTRLNAPARPLQTLSMREMGETVVGLLQTSGAPQQAGNGTDWEWLAVDWRDYVYRLGHELDQLVDEERLSDGAKAAAEAELALLCQQLEIAYIVATPGSRVDYNQHEVVARVRANTVSPNTIMRTKRRGYIHASKLVQKAEVVVGVD